MVLVSVPVTVGITTMFTMESKAEASAPILQITIPLVCAQFPCEVVAETKFA